MARYQSCRSNWVVQTLRKANYNGLAADGTPLNEIQTPARKQTPCQQEVTCVVTFCCGTPTVMMTLTPFTVVIRECAGENSR
uniref:Transposase n=1 Tax=Panagrellus redivivus TaxID=6233 RepID=A0A7E4UUP5_PANRE